MALNPNHSHIQFRLDDETRKLLAELKPAGMSVSQFAKYLVLQAANPGKAQSMAERAASGKKRLTDVSV